MEGFFSCSKKRISLVSTAIAMNRLTLLSHIAWLSWFRMTDFTCWKWFVCVYSSVWISQDTQAIVCSRTADDKFYRTVFSFGIFIIRMHRIRLIDLPIFFQQFSFVCCSNEQMKKCKSVNLMFVFSILMLRKSQTSAIKFVFSFIRFPNQSNSEVGN